MKPPLRTLDDAAAIVEGLVSGAIDAIATDHAPHPGSEKMQEFERCPFGIIGLETALAVALETLVHSGTLPLMRVVELMSLGPARVLNLDRGRLAPGAVADVTLFDPELVWTYDVNRSYSKSRNTPFDGRTFRGAPVATMVNGKFVWSRNKEC
jgi:dihydroorotase